MGPLLPSCSRRSKPLVHKSQVPGGPGDRNLYDDPLIFVGFTSRNLLQATYLAPRILRWFLLFFLDNLFTLDLYIVFLRQAENVFKYSNRVSLYCLSFIVSSVVTTKLAIFLAWD